MAGSSAPSVSGMWKRDVDGLPCVLGPLAVDPSLQGHGLGSTLMWASIGRARALGHGAIVLVGDAP